MPEYAKATTVDRGASLTEIEKTLTRWGADQFAYMVSAQAAQVAFEYQGLRVRINVPLPDRAARQFTHHARGKRTDSAAQGLYEQAVRQRYRALLLVVKAKVEAVESGISTFADEFYGQLVLPSGQTVAEATGPQVQAAIAGGARLGPLMLDAS